MSLWAVSSLPQTEHLLPSVLPGAVQVAALPGTVTGLCPAALMLRVSFAPPQRVQTRSWVPLAVQVASFTVFHSPMLCPRAGMGSVCRSPQLLHLRARRPASVQVACVTVVQLPQLWPVAGMGSVFVPLHRPPSACTLVQWKVLTPSAVQVGSFVTVPLSHWCPRAATSRVWEAFRHTVQKRMSLPGAVQVGSVCRCHSPHLWSVLSVPYLVVVLPQFLHL